MSNIILYLSVFVFLMGLYFYAMHGENNTKIEGFKSKGFKNKNIRCPNLLIQKHGRYYLYNNNIAEVPGVNPIVFDNLEDYVEFIEWQQSIGIRCPVLYLQKSQNTQGEDTYNVRPSVTNLHGGNKTKLIEKKFKKDHFKKTNDDHTQLDTFEKKLTNFNGPGFDTRHEHTLYKN